MRIAVMWAAAAIAAAVLCGCGSEKQLPEVDAVTASDTADPTARMPKESDPKAVELVNQALEAATRDGTGKGDPARLAKTRVIRVVASGHMRLAGQNPGLAPVEAKRTFQAVWPDRARWDYELTARQGARALLGFRRPAAWMFQFEDGRWRELTPQAPGQIERLAAVESVGNDWMALLVPLLDVGDPQKVVVFDPQTVTDEPQPAHKIKVHVRSCGPVVFTLWFDPATHYLRRVEYTQTSDAGQQVNDAMVLDGHKPFGGVVLPTRLEHDRNREPVEVWTVESVEFPDKIDEAQFDPPKTDEKK
jgi:hypothetical protein